MFVIVFFRIVSGNFFNGLAEPASLSLDKMYKIYMVYVCKCSLSFFLLYRDWKVFWTAGRTGIAVVAPTEVRPNFLTGKSCLNFWCISATQGPRLTIISWTQLIIYWRVMGGHLMADFSPLLLILKLFLLRESWQKIVDWLSHHQRY
jgi:hypothetical protein